MISEEGGGKNFVCKFVAKHFEYCKQKISKKKLSTL